MPKSLKIPSIPRQKPPLTTGIDRHEYPFDKAFYYRYLGCTELQKQEIRKLVDQFINTRGTS